MNSDKHEPCSSTPSAEHGPSQKEFLLKIPINAHILNSLYKGRPPVTTNEAWSVVMVQKRVEVLDDPNRFNNCCQIHCTRQGIARFI